MAILTRLLCLMLIMVVSAAVFGQDKKVASTDAQKEASGIVEKAKDVKDMRTIRVRDNRIVYTKPAPSNATVQRGKASVVEGKVQVIKTLKPSTDSPIPGKIKNKKHD